MNTKNPKYSVESVKASVRWVGLQYEVYCLNVYAICVLQYAVFIRK